MTKKEMIEGGRMILGVILFISLVKAVFLVSTSSAQDLAYYDPAALKNDDVSAPTNRVQIAIEPEKELLVISPLFYGVNQTILPASFAFRNRELIRRLKPDVIRIFTQKQTLWKRVDGEPVREDFELSPAKGVYHWKQLDELVAAIVDCGAKPYLSLGFGAPPWLYESGSRRFILPPRDRFDEFAEYMADIVRFLSVEKKYPIRQVTIDNEPENVKYAIDDFVELVHRARIAIRKAAPDVVVGGPATGYAAWTQPDGRRLSFDRSLRHLKEKETPFDFIDWHVYATAPSVVMNTVKIVRDIYGPQGELVLSEFNRDWRYATPEDQAQSIANNAGWPSVAWLIYLYDHLQRAGVSQAHYFDLVSTPFGLLDYWNTEARPNYFTFWACTSLLGRERVVATSAHPALGVIATRDSGALTALVYNRATVGVEVLLQGMNADSMIRFDQAWYEQNKTIQDGELRMPVWGSVPKVLLVPPGGFVVVRSLKPVQSQEK